MAHDLYEHGAPAARVPWRLPSPHRIALCVFLYFECFEIDAPANAYRDPRFNGNLGDLYPNYRANSVFEYGNRVGVFRVLQALDRFGLTATVAANADACERYPFLVNEFKRRNYEFAAHGISATQMITSRMTDVEERCVIADSRRTVMRTTGQRPVGWIGQDYGETPRTPQCLADEGFVYVADWGNNDHPYLMRTNPALVSVPNQAEWDDVQLAWLRQVPLPVYRDTLCEAFNVLYSESETSAAFFGIHLHPWFIGWPHRIGYLEAALTDITQRQGIWSATAAGIVTQWMAKCAPPLASETPARFDIKEE
jgi:peptidoglycan/xylan/chitin deacetylase (PgdA/CDA1 family)